MIKDVFKEIWWLILIIIIVLGSLGWYVFNTQSGARFIKGLQSNAGDGLYREVLVYTESGELIYEDKGKFDVEVSETRIKYIDDKDKLHIIYLGNSSTGIVNELEE